MVCGTAAGPALGALPGGNHMLRRTGPALLGLMLFCAANAATKPGDLPPQALGTDSQGTALTLPALRGKVVVLSFWATWCGYCMKEMPVLASMQNVADAKHLPLQVVLINYEEDHDVFRRTSRLLRRETPGVLTTWDRHGEIGKPYGADGGIPVMVMLRRDGTVAHLHVGYGEDMLDSLLAEINALLREPAPAAGGT
jgi:thiol-disulfide isomerase/thioredoxin